LICGFAWLPDGTGLVYSSSRGETMLYLPTQRLWHLAIADGAVRPLTSGEVSYVHPDIARSGAVVVGRVRLESDIWRFPTSGPPQTNVDKATRITNQTGHVLTPTSSPDDTEVAFLSDRGGRANLWAINVETGALRQITREHDPDLMIGVPAWSPANNAIAFVSSRGRSSAFGYGIWLVNPAGSNLRQLAFPAVSPTWSPNGHAVYYAAQGVFKITEGGKPITLQTSRVRNVIGSDGKTMYMTVDGRIIDGLPELEIRAANPENAPSRVLAKVSSSRVPFGEIFNPTLSPDGKSMAQSLTDGFSTNIWILSTSTGEWRQITDFGGRPTFIARKVSWSSDGRSVLAAVAEGDADIVLLGGLLQTEREPQ
jgi:Tol biopolymer transport system component